MLEELLAEIKTVVSAPITIIDEELGVIGWEHRNETLAPHLANYKPRKQAWDSVKRRHWKPNEIEEAKRLRLAGMSLNQLKERFGCRSASALTRILGPELSKKQRKPERIKPCPTLTTVA